MTSLKMKFLSPLAALVLCSNVYADDIVYSLEKQSLKDAIEKISKQSKIPYITQGKLLEGKRSNAIENIKGTNQALEKLLENSGLEALIEDGAIIIKKKIKKPKKRTSSEAHKFEDIMVTGELQERSLQDTHSSVSVILGEDLDNSLDQDLNDVIQKTAGINTDGYGISYQIRGIGDRGVGAGSGQAISYEIDGARINSGYALRSSSMYSTWDLDQVEILKGAQSTQQGQNAMAGAVNIKTKDPIFEEEYKFRADYASYNEKRIAGAVNIPLSENWAFRLTGEYLENDGFIDDSNSGEDLSKSESKNVRAKLRYMNDNFDAVLTAYKSKKNVVYNNIILSQYPNKIVRDSNNQAEPEGESDIYSLRFSYDLNENWTIKSETSHSKTKFVQGDSTGVFTVEDKNNSQELKALYSDENIRWVGGVYYNSLDNKDTSITDNYPIAPTVFLSSTGGESRDVKNKAIFTELEYDLSEKWTVVAGLRYDKEEQKYAQKRVTSVTPTDPYGLAGTIDVSNENDYDALLPKLGLVYKIDEDISTGFTIQKAYRAGGNGVNAVSTKFDYEPEYTTNYEWSFRSLLLNKALKFNTNVFYSDYKDMQTQKRGPKGNLDLITENAGKSQLYGIEIETDYRVNEALNIFLNLAYTKTKFKDYGDLTGNEFRNAPNWTGALGGTYKFDRNIAMNLYGSYTGSSYGTTENKSSGKADPHFVVNTSVTYESDDNWAAKLYVRNLFDKEYFSFVNVDDNNGTLGDPRVIGISLSYKF